MRVYLGVYERRTTSFSHRFHFDTLPPPWTAGSGPGDVVNNRKPFLTYLGLHSRPWAIRSSATRSQDTEIIEASERIGV